MRRFAASCIVCLLLTGCPPERRDGDPRSVDILLVVDNSNSMARLHEELQASLPAALAGQIEGGLDFQVGVTTSDLESAGNGGQGNLRSAGAIGGSSCETPRLATSEDEDLAATLIDLIDVGISGSGEERGLAAATFALCKAQPDTFWELPLSDPARAWCDQVPVSDRACNQGFLRENAGTALLLVTDEGDSSGALLPPDADAACANDCDCRSSWLVDILVSLAPNLSVHTVGPTYQSADPPTLWCGDTELAIPGPCNPFGNDLCSIDLVQQAACFGGGMFHPMEVKATPEATCELADFEQIAADFAASL